MYAHRTLGGPDHFKAASKTFLSSHSFLGFVDEYRRVAHWKKLWPTRSKYKPHQSEKECARRMKHGI